MQWLGEEPSDGLRNPAPHGPKAGFFDLQPTRKRLFPRAEKNLAALVEASGSELNALRAVQVAANRALAEGRLVAGPNGVLPGNGLGAVLTVNGVNIRLIGGRIVNGVVEIGSIEGL